MHHAKIVLNAGIIGQFQRKLLQLLPRFVHVPSQQVDQTQNLPVAYGVGVCRGQDAIQVRNRSAFRSRTWIPHSREPAAGENVGPRKLSKQKIRSSFQYVREVTTAEESAT